MKKLIAVFIVFVLVITSGCVSRNSLNNDGTENLTSKKAESTLEQSTPSDGETESVTDSPVVSYSQDGCMYGEKTGTEKTYTGLEPLPLSDFETAEFENTKGLPDKLIEHSYGVAKNGEAHEISKNNQKFFDEGGYSALALDTKSTDKVLYLTFDCGYENGYTAKILDVLKEKGVKAAFFCTLPEMKQNPEIIARMINEGHIVGNHSVTHPNFAELTRKEMYEEVKGFDDYIREHFGYSSLYFRYPQGKYSENSLSMLNSMGYKCIFWSLAYADWDLDNQKGGSYALETVVSRLHPGAVILLHAVSPDNAAALGDIIDTAQSMGYEFRPLSEADI